MKANFEKRRAECQANPEKCRAERTARFEQRFKGADADGNGTISRAEAEKAMPRLARHFDRVDANKDGQVTRDEIMAARKAHMERRKPRPEPSKI
jgi:Ca2+-binding EF-hand superfamily protein